MDNLDYQKAISEFVEHEGYVGFELAPLNNLPLDLPDLWKVIFSNSDPVGRTLKDIWSPWQQLLPGTISELQKKLRYVGLLQTRKIPFSMIYCFQSEDDVTFRRGYPCQPIQRNEAKLLPDEFLDLYKIHNGWTDIHGFAGYLPFNNWFDLTYILDEEYSDCLPGIPLEDFLIVCDCDASDFLGFDMAKAKPIGLRCSFHRPLEVVPDMVRALDELMAVQLRDLT